AAEKGIDIECRVQGDLPPVNADRLRIGQALANLIGNALKFTEPGGSVEVSVQSRSEEHTSELQSRENLVCRLLLEKKKPKSRRTRLSWRNPCFQPRVPR